MAFGLAPFLFCGMGKLTSLAPMVRPLQDRVKAPPKVADQFYLSREWRRLVARVKRKRGAFCQRCGSRDRVIADHVIERRDGGAELDENNIELLCFTHHQQKTALARKRRARGQA